MQGFNPRMKDKMHYEELGERRVMLNLMVLLHNFRTSRVGINQITNSFMPYLSKDNKYFTDEFREIFLSEPAIDAV